MREDGRVLVKGKEYVGRNLVVADGNVYLDNVLIYSDNKRLIQICRNGDDKDGLEIKTLSTASPIFVEGRVESCSVGKTLMLSGRYPRSTYVVGLKNHPLVTKEYVSKYSKSLTSRVDRGRVKVRISGFFDNVMEGGSEENEFNIRKANVSRVHSDSDVYIKGNILGSCMVYGDLYSCAK